MIVSEATTQDILLQNAEHVVSLIDEGVTYMAAPFFAKDYPELEITTEYGVIQTSTGTEGGEAYNAGDLEDAIETTSEMHSNWSEMLYC